VIGVSKDASEDEIKSAYRKLAKATHPDGNGGSSDDFRRVQGAYELIEEDRF